MNDSSPSDPQPTINGDLPSESKQFIDLESKPRIGDSTSGKETMNGNRTDDEKTSSLQMPAKTDAYTTNRERETSWYNSEEVTTKPSLVEETVLVATAPTAQSSATSRMDGLFLNLDEDKGLLGNQARYNVHVCLSVCLFVSPCVCPFLKLRQDKGLPVNQSQVQLCLLLCVCVCRYVCVCLSVRWFVCVTVGRWVVPLVN